jgi:hypothetical protein
LFVPILITCLLRMDFKKWDFSPFRIAYFHKTGNVAYKIKKDTVKCPKNNTNRKGLL